MDLFWIIRSNPSGRRSSAAYTLLELLIALGIFSLLSLITIGSLLRLLKIEKHIEKQMDRQHEISRGLNNLRDDIFHYTNINVYESGQPKLQPSLEIQNNHLYFNRTGVTNPRVLEKSPFLRRIAYLCQAGELLRKSWLPSNPQSMATTEKVIFTHLTKCEISYYDHKLQILKIWPLENTDKFSSPSPKAIRLDLTFSDWGNILLIFPLYQGIYAETNPK